MNTSEGENGDRLEVSAPDGKICLSMTLTEAGPVLELQGVSLQIAAEETLRLQCRDLDLDVARDVRLRAGGDLVQQAGGDMRLAAEGELRTEASAQHQQARLGDFEVHANDDVMLDGERVRLNSPRTPIKDGSEQHTRELLRRLMTGPEDPEGG